MNAPCKCGAAVVLTPRSTVVILDVPFCHPIATFIQTSMRRQHFYLVAN